MLILLGLLFGAIFGFQIFKSKMIKEHMSKNTAPPVTVSAMQAKYDKWQPTIKSTGTLRAYRGVDVTTEIAGLVRKIYFRSGMRVKEGDNLLQLNDDAEIAQLNSLKATEQLSKTTYERDKAQFKIKAISKAVLDTDQSNLQNIQAQVKQQMAIIAKKNIRAPFSGKLGISIINPGQYLNPGDKIVTLQTLDPVFVDFYIPQQLFNNIKIGQTIQLTSDSQSGKIFKGKITTIDPKVDVATRNIHVEASFSNKQQNLLPGMFVKIEIISGKKVEFLTLPQTAISFNPYGEMAFVVKKDPSGMNIATEVPITAGERRGDQIAILKGIEANDLIITSGQLKLKNGMKVVINNEIEPSNNPMPQTIDE